MNPIARCDARTVQPVPRARLLSFDGGGIRGLFALQIAARIEALLRKQKGNPNLVLADHFHYIGGTSTGAIIAALLSWGFPAAEVQRMYEENARAMFRKAGFLERLYRYKFVSEGITNFLRTLFVEGDGKEATLGTARLKTMLLIVTKNASTGSPWPLSNNPNAKYNSPGSPGCNLAIPLWQLVRASTAAPTFFPPEILQMKGERGEPLTFAFEDGGVTPFNNPAFQLYAMATLPEYALCWASGRERLSLVSIGTGRVGLGRGDSLFADVLTHARTLPAALIDAGQQSQDMICRVTGECRFGEALDSEMGTMVREKPGAPFLYARYNKTFTSGELEEMKKLSRKGFGMDNVDLMDAIVQAGRSYAQESVDLGHFE